jgi:hypothetical protein
LLARAIGITGQFSALDYLLTGEERPQEVAEYSQLQPTLVNAYCAGQQVCSGQRRSSQGLLPRSW